MINLFPNPRLAEDSYGHAANNSGGLTGLVQERAALPAAAGRDEFAWHTVATNPDTTIRTAGWVSPTAEAVPVEEGKTYTVIAEVYVAALTGEPGLRVDLLALDAGAAQVATTTGSLITAALGWNYYRRTWTIPADLGVVSLRLNPEGRFDATGEGIDAYFGRTMVLEGDVETTFFDGDWPGAEWLGEPGASASRYPALPQGALVPGQEINVGRRGFPEAQRLFASGLERRVGSLIDVGWYGTEVHPESGAFALVRIGGPLEDLVGEVVRVARPDTEREAYVYVLGARDVPEDLVLFRRAFAELGGLYLERLSCLVEVQR